MISVSIVYADLVREEVGGLNLYSSKVVLLLPFITQETFITPNSPNNRQVPFNRLSIFPPVMWQFTHKTADQDISSFIRNRINFPLPVIKKYKYIVPRMVVSLSLPILSQEVSNGSGSYQKRELLFYNTEILPFINLSNFFTEFSVYGSTLTLKYGVSLSSSETHNFTLKIPRGFYEPVFDFGSSGLSNPNLLVKHDLEDRKVFFYFDVFQEPFRYYYPVIVPHFRRWLPFVFGEYSENSFSYLYLFDYSLLLTRGYYKEGDVDLGTLIQSIYNTLERHSKRTPIFHNTPMQLNDELLLHTHYFLSQQDISVSDMTMATMFYSLSETEELTRNAGKLKDGYIFYYFDLYRTVEGMEAKIVRFQKPSDPRLKQEFSIPTSKFEKEEDLLMLAFTPVMNLKD